MIARLALLAASFSVPLGIIVAAVRSQGPGLTRGNRAWLDDQYPDGTADRIDAIVRAANATRR